MVFDNNGIVDIQHHKQQERNLTWIISVVVFIFTVAVNLYLFRGSTRHGMEFDEVYRLNNMFPIFRDGVYPYNQAICSLDLGGLSIPLMYKEYISSLHLLPLVPAVFFRDTLAALRCLYLVYTIGFEVLIYFFLKKQNEFVAAVSACLIAVCPFLFPYIRYGWAYLTYGYFLLAGCSFALKFRESRKRIILFFAAFFFALLVNVYFYALWIIGGLLFAIALLFPKKTLQFFKEWRNILFSLVGVLFGLFNYLVYNIQNGFPSLKTLFNYLFRLNTYNEKAIDGSKTSSLLDSFVVKLDSYKQCIGINKDIYLLLLGCICLIYLVFFVRLLIKKRLKEKKAYFFSFIVTIVSFVLMLISPNSQGSHHLTFIVVSLGITMGVGLWLVISEFGVKKEIVIGIACFVCIFNLYQCHEVVKRDIISNGNGYFTEKIFDLVDYVKEEPILTDENVKFIEWGFSSQFYFLNNGEFQLDDITFGIRNHTDQEREAYLKGFFQRLDEDVIFVPAYYADQAVIDVKTIAAGLEDFSYISDINFDDTSVDYSRMEVYAADVARMHAPVQAFIHYVWNNDGDIMVQKYFDDDDGPDIVLLKVSNIDRIKQSAPHFPKSVYGKVAKSVFTKADEYEYLMGFYGYETSSQNRWVQKQSAILLNRADNKNLYVKFWVPHIDMRDESETILRISINDHEICNTSIENSHLYELVFSLDELGVPLASNETAEISFELNSKVLSENDKRELAMCIEEIAFVDNEQSELGTKPQTPQPELSSYFFKSDEFDELSGYYDYEVSNNLRWVQKKSTILLNRANHNRLLLKFWVPKIDERDEPDTYLRVYLNDHEICNELVRDSNMHEWAFSLDELDIPIKQNEDVEILLEVSSSVLSENDKRELAMCIEEIGFVD